MVHHAPLQGKPITFASALAPATTPWIAMWLANMSFTRSCTIVGLSSRPSLGLLVQR